MFLERERHRHEAAGLVFGAELDGFGALAGELVDGRLRIEEVGTEWAAVHEKLNDTADSGCGVGAGDGGGERGQGEGAESASEGVDGLAAG